MTRGIGRVGTNNCGRARGGFDYACRRVAKDQKSPTEPGFGTGLYRVPLDLLAGYDSSVCLFEYFLED